MRVIPLRYNYFQRKYLAERTPRDLILKPRQRGFTTFVQAEFRRYEWTRSARTLSLGKDDENTTDIRAMADFFYDNLPENFRPNRSINNATRTTYPMFNSRATIRTAGNRNSGRGGTNTHIHLSEAAFYPDAKSIVASALQAGNPLWVVAESTANGAQGWFYDECNAALRGDSIFTLHFFTWFDSPDFALSNDELVVLHPNGDAMVHTPYTDEEKELVSKHNLSPEQINWRRYKISELGDLFPQEYPEDPETCFLTSGRGVFQINKPGLFSVSIEDSAIIGHPVWVLDGYTPSDDSVHVMGIDWGQSPEETAVSIWSSIAYRKIAQYVTGKRDYEYIIGDIVQLAKIYNVRYIVPEANSMRMQISFLAKGLTEAMPDNMPKISPFVMTNKRKDDLVKLFQQGINDGMGLLDEPRGKHQLRTFEATQTTSGLWTYSHPTDGQDDIVIADMLGNLACYQLRDRL